MAPGPPIPAMEVGRGFGPSTADLSDRPFVNRHKTCQAISPGENAAVSLREKPGDDGSGEAPQGGDDLMEEVLAEEDLGLGDPEALILCRRCGHGITRPDERILVEGQFQHTFANPSGRVFEIGCFRDAAGCAASGEPTDEFTWFRGYQWRLALCRACFGHLGWQFSTAGGGFWGLILNRLSFPL